MPDANADLWMEFVHPDTNLCGLCANHGVIDTRGKVYSTVGVEAGVLRFCICPNGLAMKAKGWRLESPRLVPSIFLRTIL